MPWSDERISGRARHDLGAELELAAALPVFLDELRGPRSIIGGIAVIACGVQRLTPDIDVAVAGEDLSAAALADELERLGFEPRIRDAVAFAEENQVLLMRHRASGVEIDVSRRGSPSSSKRLKRRSSNR